MKRKLLSARRIFICRADIIIENILAVIALAYDLGITATQLHDVIANFKAVEHRLERVTVIDGATYFNDSKATNTDSAIKSIGII